jgi:Protease inhibitor Inh
MDSLRLSWVLVMLGGLGACDASSRLAGLGGSLNPNSAPPRRVQPVPEPLTPVPTPQVQSAPLGAPGGVSGGNPTGVGPGGSGSTLPSPVPSPVDPSLQGANRGLNNPGLPGGPAAGSPIPGQPGLGTVTPGSSGIVTTPGQGGAVPGGAVPGVRPPDSPGKRPPQVAAVEEKPAAAPTRNSVTGNWTASEASGTSCKVTLSSASALDLYKASSSGCGSRDLQKISAWELRGNDIYLYEQGGAVAARLQQSAGGRYSGAGAKSGAPITLSK